MDASDRAGTVDALPPACRRKRLANRATAEADRKHLASRMVLGRRTAQRLNQHGRAQKEELLAPDPTQVQQKQRFG